MADRSAFGLRSLKVAGATEQNHAGPAGPFDCPRLVGFGFQSANDRTFRRTAADPARRYFRRSLSLSDGNPVARFMYRQPGPTAGGTTTGLRSVLAQHLSHDLARLTATATSGGRRAVETSALEELNCADVAGDDVDPTATSVHRITLDYLRPVNRCMLHRAHQQVMHQAMPAIPRTDDEADGNPGVTAVHDGDGAGVEQTPVIRSRRDGTPARHHVVDVDQHPWTRIGGAFGAHVSRTLECGHSAVSVGHAPAPARIGPLDSDNGSEVLEAAEC